MTPSLPISRCRVPSGSYEGRRNPRCQTAFADLSWRKSPILLATALAAKQDDPREKTRRITGIRLVLTIPNRKRDGVVSFHFDLTGIRRRRARPLHLAECGVSSVAVDVGVKEGRTIVQHVHIRRGPYMDAGELSAYLVGTFHGCHEADQTVLAAIACFHRDLAAAYHPAIGRRPGLRL